MLAPLRCGYVVLYVCFLLLLVGLLLLVWRFGGLEEEEEAFAVHLHFCEVDMGIRVYLDEGRLGQCS